MVWLINKRHFKMTIFDQINMNIDIHTLVDLLVLGITAFASFESSKTKLAVVELKLWIIQNFETKKTPTVPGSIDTPTT